MKIDFLEDGAPDCPLVRIYAFTQEEILSFRNSIRNLARKNLGRFDLPNELDLNSANRCALALVVGENDRGLLRVQPHVFDCVLTAVAWDNMAGMVDPFCRPTSSGFQWLYLGSGINLLLTHDGLW